MGGEPAFQRRSAARVPSDRDSIKASVQSGFLAREREVPAEHAAGNLAIWHALAAHGVRAKATISQPRDPEEEEADRFAEAAVSHTPVPVPNAKCVSCAGGQPCDRCEDEAIHAKHAGATSSPPASSMDCALAALQGGGDPLPTSIRRMFEPRVERDLSQVRVHTDSFSGAAAQAIGARAYTIGTHIGFAPGEFRPHEREGRRLLAHELAHVRRSTPTVRRQGAAPPPTPAAPAGQDATAVKVAADVIVDALEGYTSASDSEAILQQFRGRSPAMVLATVTEVKNRGGAHSKTGDEMVDWLLNDVTEEHRHALRQILIQSGSPDVARIVVDQIKDRLEGYTSEADSAEIHALFAGYAGSAQDGLLGRLESAMRQGRDAMSGQLFGDLDRVNAERLRALFFGQGGPTAAGYAAAWTARKIMALLEGYTSHSDSTDIVWNLRTTPTELRGLVQAKLDELCRAARGQPAEEVLMHDMDASDYERLRAMGGLALKPWRDTRSAAEKVVSAIEWAEVVLEWTTCGVVGIATGLLSAAWDILRGIKDIAVGVWDLIWSLIYLVSGGAAGSENWLRVKTFFTGIGSLFSDPGKVWDQFWDEQALEFHTIEGPLADCRRAELLVRKFISAAVNILLVFVAGYGIAKGVVSGVRTVAAGAELAEIIGVRGVASVVGRLAARGVAKFVPVASEVAGELLNVIRRPAALLQTINARLRSVIIAAEDAGYWRYLRQQAGTAVQAGAEAATEQLAGERRFWEENRRFWRERGMAQQARQDNLAQDLGTVEQHLNANERPDPATTITDLRDDAVQLDRDSTTLQGDVVGRVERAATPAAAAKPGAAVPSTQGVSLDELIEEALRDIKTEPVGPLNPAEFGPPPQRIVSGLREISLDEIPSDRRGYYEAAYPGYVQRREAGIAAGVRSSGVIMARDDYVRFRWGRDQGVLIRSTRARPLNLGRTGAIEQAAGHILEQVVDARLPGSSNNVAFPNPHGKPVVPDHLPPGRSVVFVDQSGLNADTGQRFSARFVGDSKYKEHVDIDPQTRGFVHYAAFTDESLLVFYMRWQDGFPVAESLTFDPGLGGLVLPLRPWNEQLVGRGLRELAQSHRVTIRVVSDPAWR
jgi:hypothetical protein